MLVSKNCIVYLLHFRRHRLSVYAPWLRRMRHMVKFRLYLLLNSLLYVMPCRVRCFCPFWLSAQQQSLPIPTPPPALPLWRR